MQKTTVVMATLSVWALACSGGEPTSSEPSDSTESSIVGGIVDTVDVNVGGFIGFRSPMPTTGSAFFGCTGTLIGPRTVLTAGHCVGLMQKYNYATNTFYFTFGNNFDPTGYMLLNPNQMVKHPSCNPADITHYGCANGAEVQDASIIDVGLVYLSAPVSGVPFATLAPANTIDAVKGNGTYTLVGYGFESWDGRKDNTYVVDGSRRYAPFLFDYIVNAGWVQLHSPNASACLVDSGGPLFLTTATTGKQIVAVESNSDVVCTVGSPERSARVDNPVARNWILAHLTPP